VEKATKLTALVTDIELGTGPNGFDVAHRVRTDNPHLPVVFTSGTAWAPQRAEQIALSEFIPMPFRPFEIIEALGRLGCRVAQRRRDPDE
jgi:CheY-like chemotaxis protein